MKRLHLGLTDFERRQMDEKRRVRNCLIVLGLLILLMSAI